MMTNEEEEEEADYRECIQHICHGLRQIEEQEENLKVIWVDLKKAYKEHKNNEQPIE